MQGQRSVFDPFPGTVDLNQGSNSNGMDETDDWNNMLSHMERRLLNNDLSNELNFSCVNTDSHNSFRSLQGQVSNNGQHWSNSASHIPLNVNLNVGFEATDSDDDDGMGRSSEYGPVSSHQSSSGNLLLNEFLDRGQVGNHSNQQPPLLHVPNIPRNAHHFPWGGSIGSRSRSSSSLLRNNVQIHNFIPPSESRNLVQDPTTNWSLATGSSGSGGAPSSSRNGIGGSSGSCGFNGVWTPQHNNHTTPSQQRSSEFPPWTLFPSADVEYSEDNHIQRHNYPSFSRSALLMEVPGDDWRALAADIEGRQRLVSEIRQVLNAMRRGENLRAEDYMLFDPFISGVAELHDDRHRDLRLDVDNMSYEELLALEERIGNVNTGLSEEVILKSMKQRKHIGFMAISTQNIEPCCICQEDYDTGDNIGTLDCGHDFHTDCIKQWLAQKNTCPICKMSGLAT